MQNIWSCRCGGNSRPICLHTIFDRHDIHQFAFKIRLIYSMFWFSHFSLHHNTKKSDGCSIFVLMALQNGIKQIKLQLNPCLLFLIMHKTVFMGTVVLWTMDPISSECQFTICCDWCYIIYIMLLFILNRMRFIGKYVLTYTCLSVLVQNKH